MIAEFIKQLKLQDVTVVGNDTGGALCQILCANYPELVDRLVLTNCDSFEHFPPFLFRLSYRLGGRVPGLIVGGRYQALRRQFLRRAGLAAIPVTMRPLPDEQLISWFAALRNPHIRADLQAVLRGHLAPAHLGRGGSSEDLRPSGADRLGRPQMALPRKPRATSRRDVAERPFGADRQRPHLCAGDQPTKLAELISNGPNLNP